MTSTATCNKVEAKLDLTPNFALAQNASMLHITRQHKTRNIQYNHIQIWIHSWTANGHKSLKIDCCANFQGCAQIFSKMLRGPILMVYEMVYEMVYGRGSHMWLVHLMFCGALFRNFGVLRSFIK